MQNNETLKLSELIDRLCWENMMYRESTKIYDGNQKKIAEGIGDLKNQIDQYFQKFEEFRKNELEVEGLDICGNCGITRTNHREGRFCCGFNGYNPDEHGKI